MSKPFEKIGFYRIIRKLGSGAMADVYEAEDERLKRRVALKVLPRQFGDDSDRVDRFDKEVLATAKLNHPNIVTIFDVGHEDGLSFYTMSLLPGGELKAKIQKGMTKLEVVEICRQVAKALGHAHATGFVHRDLKPENVLFDEFGQAIVTDLGIAKLIGNDITQTGMSLGTPYYMSPEQALGRKIDGRSDLYSLGAMLYRMLTREPMFDAEESLGICLKQIQEPAPALPEHCSEFQPLLDKLVAKAPEDRFQDAHAFIDALNAITVVNSTLPPTSELDKTQVMGTEAPTELQMQNEKTETFVFPEQSSAKATHARPKRGLVLSAAVFAVLVGLTAVYIYSQGQPSQNAGVSSVLTAVSDIEPQDDPNIQPSDHPSTEPEPVITKAEPELPAGTNTEVKPEVGRAMLLIKGAPSGADVLVNGSLVGSTPLMQENLAEGTHQITVTKQFYAPQTFELTFANDELVEQTYALAKGVGRLTVVSTPSEATIRLNGKPVQQKSPASFESLQAGEYEIEMQLGSAFYQGKFALDHEQKLVIRPALTDGKLISYNDQWLKPEDLVKLAKQDEEKNRQIFPENNSALGKYRALLSWNSQHAEAKSRIASIMAVLKTTLENLIQAGEKDESQFSAAEKMLAFIDTEIPEFGSTETLKKQLGASKLAAAAARDAEQYAVAVGEFNALVSSRNFSKAAELLVQLEKNFPTQNQNGELQQTLNLAIQNHYDKVERYSGKFVLVPKSAIKGDDDVSLSVESFYIGEKEVTVSQWQQCVNDGQCEQAKGDANQTTRGDYPITNVSYESIVEQYIPWINSKTGLRFRLPTEAEFEAAVGQPNYHWGSQISPGKANGAERFGWPSDGAEGLTEVGSYPASSLGIYDLHGNAAEWTASCWYAARNDSMLKSAEPGCQRLVVKGGSWFSAPKFMVARERRNDSRFDQANDKGFRLVEDVAGAN